LLQDCHRAHAAFIARRVPHYTLLVLPLLVRDCLFVRIYLLISQLTYYLECIPLAATCGRV